MSRLENKTLYSVEVIGEKPIGMCENYWRGICDECEGGNGAIKRVYAIKRKGHKKMAVNRNLCGSYNP